MRLRFGVNDEGAFYEARDGLLTEFAEHSALPEQQRAEVVADIETFLDWRFHYSNGELDNFAQSDIAEFLLEYCPRKVSRPTGSGDELCGAVGEYVTFLADTGRLIGGARRAALLRRATEDLAPIVREEMDNPANYGMAKSLLAGVEFPPDASHDEIQAILNARMNEHNALPFEERRAITDQFFDHDFDDDDFDEPPAEPYVLPFVYVPPPQAAVEAAAASSPLLAKAEALREYLAADGKPLTDKGNLKLADGRALIELLDTGDEMDPEIGGKIWRTVSSADLPRLNFLLEVAKEAGAVRVHKRRLVPVKAWAAKSTVQRAGSLFAAVVDLGPLETERPGRIWYMAELDEVLDDGIVHWLAPLLGQDEADFDTFVDLAISVVNRRFANYVDQHVQQTLEEFTPREMSHIFEVLEFAGAVSWTGRSEVPDNWGRSHWTGGTVSLTALGRHVVPDLLDAIDYVLRRIDDVADGDGTALIDAMVSAGDQYDAVVTAWQPERPASERVQLIADALVASTTADARLMGFAALHQFDPDMAEPVVRQLLETPVAGHAALWLMQHDRVDAEMLGNFVDTAVLVDVLSTLADAPDELCGLFGGVPDPEQFIEDMWRHPAPETALVLDALGHHLPDKKLAKAARKAAMRHRSWMANR